MGRKPRPLAELDAIGSTQASRIRKRRKDALREERVVDVAAIHVPDPGDLPSLIVTVPGFDPYLDAGDCVFDESKARAAIDFFQRRLVLVEGRDSGKPFVLASHQQAEIANLYGWRRPDGTRRFREAYISEARKNGKTTRVAGMVVYELAEPIEEGSQIYSAASRRDQAKLVFRLAAQMCQRSASMKDVVRVWKHSIVNLADELTSYQAISAEATGAHGYNPQFVVMDELHLQESRDLYDALKSGMGARAQPLLVSITTAGFDRNSICWEMYQHAKAVMRTGENRIADSTFFPAIYELDEKDDWRDRSIWKKANPNLGVTVREDFLLGELKKAEANPSLENVFRQLYCNQWTQSAIRWLDMRDWDRCKDDAVPGSDVRWWGGLDLGATKDLTAFVLVCKKEDRFYVRAWFFMPDEQVDKLEKSDHVPYSRWCRQGLILTTPGRVQNYDYIRAKINEICRSFKVKLIAYDPWNAESLATQLNDFDGIKMAELRQGFVSMTEPSHLLERLVVGGDLRHDGNPVLRSHAENATILTDPAGNIKPKKDRASARIDGIVALVMALRLASMDNAGGSVYDRRAVRSL